MGCGEKVETTMRARVRHPLEEGVLTFRTTVGEAKDPETGDRYTLSCALDGSPIVEFEGDTHVTFGWDDLVRAAVEAAGKEG